MVPCGEVDVEDAPLFQSRLYDLRRFMTYSVRHHLAIAFLVFTLKEL